MLPSISEIIRLKLMPWAQQYGDERFIVAGPDMAAARMPVGVRLIPYKITGKRVVVKDHRDYNNTRGLVALWPEAGVNEVRKLKMACILSGHANYQIGEYKLQCGPGHFIFIPPGVPHSDGSQMYVDPSKSTSCEILFFLLHPRAVQCWVSRSSVNQGRQQAGNYLVLYERVSLLFHALVEEVIDVESESSKLGEKLLLIFLEVLHREMRAGRMQTVRGDTPDAAYYGITDSVEADFTARLRHYLQSNLHKPLTIERVSKEMFLSRAQFTRVVRRETGHSFNEYLTALRIEEAKRLLGHSQWTATAIAAFIGFNSPSYFRTFFREQTGLTPNEYRRRVDNGSKR